MSQSVRGASSLSPDVYRVHAHHFLPGHCLIPHFSTPVAAVHIRSDPDPDPDRQDPNLKTSTLDPRPSTLNPQRSTLERDVTTATSRGLKREAQGLRNEADFLSLVHVATAQFPFSALNFSISITSRGLGFDSSQTIPPARSLGWFHWSLINRRIRPFIRPTASA